jgi:hypothetical protein
VFLSLVSGSFAQNTHAAVPESATRAELDAGGVDDVAEERGAASISGGGEVS